GPATPFDREHVDVVVAMAWERTSRWQLRPEESDLGRAALRRRQTRDRVAARLVGGMVVRALDRHGNGSFGGVAAHHATAGRPVPTCRLASPRGQEVARCWSATSCGRT